MIDIYFSIGFRHSGSPPATAAGSDTGSIVPSCLVCLSNVGCGHTTASVFFFLPVLMKTDYIHEDEEALTCM